MSAAPMDPAIERLVEKLIARSNANQVVLAAILKALPEGPSYPAIHSVIAAARASCAPLVQVELDEYLRLLQQWSAPQQRH